MSKLPVLCICYNRSNSAKKLFSILSSIGYNEIYLSIDGPRDLQDRAAQDEIIKAAEDYFNLVYLNQLNVNHGVARGPVKALDWFFDKVEFGIILEETTLNY